DPTDQGIPGTTPRMQGSAGRSQAAAQREDYHGVGYAMTARGLSATCCIAGGGPARVMLGFLLARAGSPVIGLEQHADFLRGFRGDTLHPSTLELMAELGLDEALRKLPHEQVTRVSGQSGDQALAFADFSR